MADSIDQLQDFIEAIISQESGGNPTITNKDSGAYGLFQFMRSTYVGAARQAGIATTWPPSEANQRAVAAHLMTQYFEQTGSWRKVAQFWYAGPGSASYSEAALSRRQGGGKYPSINDYSAAVVAKMDGVVEGTSSTPTGSPATPAEIEQLVREKYPEYSFLLNDPQIREILMEAADPARGLDDTTLLSRIRATDWYQKNAQSARQWETLVNTDPATAADRVDKALLELRRRATQMGVTATDEELRALAERSLKYGYGEIELTQELADLMLGDAPAGATYSTLTQMRAMAKSYMVNVSEDELLRWAQGIVSGDAVIDDFQKSLTEMARAKFNGNAQMVGMIDAGMSPESFFADHKAMLAREWDLTPQQIDLLDPKWAGVLQTKDDKGVLRPMDLNEARKYARSQEGWDKTSVGRETTSNSILELLSKFGEIKV